MSYFLAGTDDVHDDEFVPRRLALDGVERREGGMLWLRYRVTST